MVMRGLLTVRVEFRGMVPEVRNRMVRPEVGAVLMAIVLALVRLGGETPPVDAALHSE